jgi:hypothetical protein
MNTCPICQTSNNHLVSICIKCGGFLQQKVDNINLFETLWKIIEKPSNAFKNIAMAKHKNYVMLMAIMSGINLGFIILWYYKIFDRVENTQSLFFLTVGLGAVLGLALTTIISLYLNTLAIIFKKTTLLKNIWSVISFSFVPLIYSLIFLFPAKLVAFGLNYFSSNPSPESVNELVYYIILAIEGLMILWFLILFVLAVKTVYDYSLRKSLTVCIPILGLIVFAVILSKWLIYG